MALKKIADIYKLILIFKIIFPLSIFVLCQKKSFATRLFMMRQKCANIRSEGSTHQAHLSAYIRRAREYYQERVYSWEEQCLAT